MARALLGHIGMPSEHVLALEIGRLRRRVSELEAENARLRENAPGSDFDFELHRIAEVAEPVLA
jgi:hypothetical protein